jgi:hypothetical protein
VINTLDIFLQNICCHCRARDVSYLKRISGARVCAKQCALWHHSPTSSTPPSLPESAVKRKRTTHFRHLHPPRRPPNPRALPIITTPAAKQTTPAPHCIPCASPHHHPPSHHRAGSRHQTTQQTLLTSHHTASHHNANMANMDIDFTRRNKKPRLLTDSERDKLDEFVDSIHYSSR